MEIAGNIKTRDKVIRRELRVYEQELFSATNLKESIKNLRRLEYFEDVNFSTTPGSVPHRVGDSSTEPYLFDRPLALGLDAYNWEREYTEYPRISKGADIRLSHPLRWKYTRLFGMYRFENVDFKDLQINASPVLVEASKIHNTSAASMSIRRASRDSLFAPTKGSDHSLSIEMAGLGGEPAYLRYIAETGWYFPLAWTTGGGIHARVGYMQQLSWGAMPAYEKFYLGGIETLRGFKYAEVSPRDPVTHERIGGDKFTH